MNLNHFRVQGPISSSIDKMIKMNDNSQWVEVTEIKDLFSFIKSVSKEMKGIWRSCLIELSFQIDYKDPWIIGLIGFHMVITTLTLMTRKSCNFQVFLFLVLSKYTQEMFLGVLD